MWATLAGTPSLVRLKSITRYRRLWPPPRWRVVTRPWEFLPAFLVIFLVSERSGSSRVISLKSETEDPRRPGVVGLYFLSATSHVTHFCSKISIESPSARVTMASF